jgi:hypothetical protein
MSRVNARYQKYNASLSGEAIARILYRTLPRRNGCVPVDTLALLREAQQFGVNTNLKFRRLILRHRRALIAEDRAALADTAYLHRCQEKHAVPSARDMRRQQYCFRIVPIRQSQKSVRGAAPALSSIVRRLQEITTKETK